MGALLAVTRALLVYRFPRSCSKRFTKLTSAPLLLAKSLLVKAAKKYLSRDRVLYCTDEVPGLHI